MACTGERLSIIQCAHTHMHTHVFTCTHTFSHVGPDKPEHEAEAG